MCSKVYFMQGKYQFINVGGSTSPNHYYAVLIERTFAKLFRKMRLVVGSFLNAS